MSDTIGRIAVPAPVDSGLTFPLTSDFGFGFSQAFPVVVHRFGTNDAKNEQRFQTGIGPRKFAFKRQNLSLTNRNTLLTFWEGLQGPWSSFLYNVPNADGTFALTKVIWESTPISLQYLIHACQVGFNLIEVPDPASAPSYGITSTCTRFPSSALASALTDQVQQIVPLVRIRVRESAVSDVYLSDRRCSVGGQLYLPRLLGIGEQGSDDLIVQDLSGAADSVSFTFGNADRVMTNLSKDTDLKRAVIQVSLYHVNTGTLLQLWSGLITTFASDGSQKFTVRASDPLSQVTQMYPARTVSRTCWKTFNDGVNCPYSSVGSGGDPTSCDYYFDSTNGCVSHGMTPYFGGHPASPQGVNIKDNSTGTWGIGRNTVTATSIVSDSVFGFALQEIWCNGQGDPTKALWTKAMIVAVRDESDFVDALGIIGAGPLGAFVTPSIATNADGFRYIVSPLLDGQPPHGFKVDSALNVKRDEPNMGLREISGTDPQSAIFGLSSGGVAGGNTTAAGTAFIELRRTDQSGIQPSTPEQHELDVPIDQGLSGWTWDAAGTRTLTAGLVNPFWIAINSYLRSLGMQNASSSAQLATFVLPSVFAGDGTGAAEIADTVVSAIVGGGTEKQFTFQGTVSQTKPFRDWLTEIISVGLGWFTWEFGQLKLGSKMNASAVDAYSLGNILFQSLRLDPIEASYEHLILDFADQQYQYQANTAEYQDKDHASYYGRSGSPLTSRMHSVGTSTLSQALRTGATRTREDIGGVNAPEWRNARNASWGTTLLGLTSGLGQVVSITHPDVPGLHGTCNVSGTTATWVSGDALDPSMVGKAVLINGLECIVQSVSGTASFVVDSAPGDGSGLTYNIITADMRITRYSVKRDYSIQIEAKTVTPSMYDLTVGPKPMDVSTGIVPALRYPLPLALAWAPYQIQAAATDALVPNEWNFDVSDTYASLADGSVAATLAISGKLPVNDYSANIYGAPSLGSIAVNTTGGSLPGGLSVRLALCATDSGGSLGNASAIALIATPVGTSTNQIVLSGITWPGSASGITGYVLFASTQDDLICEQLTGTGTPTTLTLNGPLARSTWSVPSAYIAKVRIKAKRVQCGVTHAKVTAVSGTSITVAPVSSADPFVAGSYTGRILSVIGRQTGSTPVDHMTITGLSSGVFTVAAVPVTVDVGDIVAVRYHISASGSTITDSGAAWTSGALVGSLVRVIAGIGRGQTPVKITANTSTTITTDSALTLDATSIVVIEDAAWSWSVDGTTFDNVNPATTAQWSIPISNLPNKAVLISGFTVDIYGNESPDGDQPVRETWIYGVDPNVAVTPTGVQNGTNPTFTIPSAPANGTDIEVFRNGVLCELTVEYSVSGTTITFVYPPRAADVIEVKYLVGY
jgi:hypothetical protein